MTPEAARSRRDEVARLRAERDAFSKRAAAKRAEAIELRKRRDFLAALIADGRAREYRESRDKLISQIAQARELYGIR